MEEKFTQYIEVKFLSDGKQGTSEVVCTAYADKIKQCLKNPDKFLKGFHYFIRKKNFQTFVPPSSGLKDALVIPRNENKEVQYYILLL